MKQKMKRFWTLDRHHEAGFTLVELIVVIAILAILGGVGIPAYSGYVKRANMQADETLMSEIRYALTLASYEHEFAPRDMVKVTKTGAQAIASVAENQAKLEEAMTKAFGENWAEVCALKYDGWVSSSADIVAKYSGTSLYGKEEDLLKTMNHLSGEMFKFFDARNPEEFPDDIKNILKEQNIPLSDSTAVANGAVLALAQTLTPEKLTGTTYTKGEETVTVEAGIKEALAAVQNPDSLAWKDGDNYLDKDGNVIDDNNLGDRVYQFGGVTANLLTAYNAVYEDPNMATLAAAATLYAYAESYAQYSAAQGTPNNKPMEILHGIDYTDKTSSEILDEIGNAFGEIMKDAQTANGGPIAGQWISSGQAGKDDTALLTVLDALNDSSDALKDNLTSDTFYTDGTAAGLVDAYLGVGSVGLANGEAAAIIVGPNDAQVYLGGLRP